MARRTSRGAGSGEAFDPLAWRLDEPAPDPATFADVQTYEEQARAVEETDPGPQLRAKDRRGNVRPADERFLTEAQEAEQAAYVATVLPTVTELPPGDEFRNAPDPDPSGDPDPDPSGDPDPDPSGDPDAGQPALV